MSRFALKTDLSTETATRTEQYQRTNTHQLFLWDTDGYNASGAIFVDNICCYNNSVCAFDSYFNENDIIDLWIGDYNGTFNVGVIKLYYCPPPGGPSLSYYGIFSATYVLIWLFGNFEDFFFRIINNLYILRSVQ